jgi:hypothetical protein
MITDNAPSRSRAKTQGSIDVSVSLAGTGGGLAGGIIMNATSYATLSIIGGLLALAVIPFVAASSRQPRWSKTTITLIPCPAAGGPAAARLPPPGRTASGSCVRRGRAG